MPALRVQIPQVDDVSSCGKLFFWLSPSWISLKMTAIPSGCNEDAVKKICKTVAEKLENGEIRPPPEKTIPSAETLFAEARAAARAAGEVRVVGRHPLPLAGKEGAQIEA